MAQPKKVLIFSVTYYPRFVGGAEVAVREITDRLGPGEYEFHLITLRLDKNLPKKEKLGNVFVYRTGFAGKVENAFDSLGFPLFLNKYIFPFQAFWKALLLSRKVEFSFVWSIMANYAGFGALLFKIFKPKIPFLLTLQEGDPIDYIRGRVLPVYPLFRSIFKRADEIQAISNYLADFGVSMGFEGEPNIVPNGVNVDHFSQKISDEEKHKVRQEFGFSKDDFILVTTSRLVVKNGLGDVINALPHLPENVKFAILGEGYLKPKLEDLAKSLHVSDRIHFHGFVSHQDMPKYLQSCDAFIRPSLSEGFGNSFIEAMAAGLPVIATPVGGIVDFLRDDETGYFCQPQDPLSIAQAVEKVCQEDNSRVVSNALKMVSEKYNWEMIVSQIKRIFDQVTK